MTRNTSACLVLITKLTIATLALGACDAEGPSQAARSELVDGTAEAAGVLQFLNAAATTFDLLDVDVGLDRRAAANLVARRDGADGVFGTADDEPFTTVADVDAVKWVGTSALNALLDYATAQGWVEGDADIVGIYDDVPFTDPERAATLELVNVASASVLDDDAALDSRAVTNIIAARPVVSLDQLSAVKYVGKSALTKLKTYAVTNGYGDGDEDPPVEPTAVSIATLADEAATHGTGSAYFGQLVSVSRAIVTQDPYVNSSGNVVLYVADPSAGNDQQLKVYISAAAGVDIAALSIFDDIALTATFTQYGADFELLLDDGATHALTSNKGGLTYDGYETIQAAWKSTASNPEGAVRLVSTYGYTYMVPMPLFLDHPMWAGDAPGLPSNSGSEQDHNWNIAAQDALDTWRATLP